MAKPPPGSELSHYGMLCMSYSQADEDDTVFRGASAAQKGIHSKRVVRTAVRAPLRREVQLDGRIRHWIFVKELGKYLRVVTLEDGETIHNAFPDRDFKEVQT